MKPSEIKYGMTLQIVKGVYKGRFGSDYIRVRRIHNVRGDVLLDCEAILESGRIVEILSVRPEDCEPHNG